MSKMKKKGCMKSIPFRKLAAIAATAIALPPALLAQTALHPSRPEASPTIVVRATSEAAPVTIQKPATLPAPNPAPADAADSAAEPKVARALPVNEREVVTQLQIFLDQQNFGPGKIDGRWGEFTGKAITHYQRAHGLAVTGQIDPNLPLDSVYPIYTTYQITEADAKRIGPCPSQPSEQAKLKSMPYTSLLEFLEERFHSDPDFLVKLNKDKNMETLKPGDIVRVPNVAPFKIEEMKE